jgi:hypothetical protein
MRIKLLRFMDLPSLIISCSLSEPVRSMSRARVSRIGRCTLVLAALARKITFAMAPFGVVFLTDTT